MRYKGKVYRPPSEAYSLIVQVTYGCSHNSCAFCDMYDDKHFSMRPMQEIREDFELARRVYHRVERVFLADGDALMRKTDELIEILGLIYGLFPECERVTCYASPTSLQIKSEDDLRLLRARGLRMVYHHRAISRPLFEKYRRGFHPYCSVASLYFWAVAGGALPDMKDYAPKTKKQTGRQKK